MRGLRYGTTAKNHAMPRFMRQKMQRRPCLEGGVYHERSECRILIHDT